jgi:spore germination protein
MKQAAISTILIICLLSNTGCWDYRDLESQNIPFVAAFDSADGKPEQFIASALSPNLDPETKGQVQLISLQTPLAGEYRTSHAHYSPELYNPGLIQAYLLGEGFARSGRYSDVVDSTERSALISSTVELAVVEGKATELLKQRPEDYSNIGLYIINQLSNAQRHSFLPTISLHKFLTNTMAGRNPILPTMRLMEDAAKLSGIAIFNKFKMVDKISIEEARTLCFLRGIKGQGIIGYKTKTNGETVDKGSVRVQNSRKVKVTRRDNRYFFDITIRLKGSLVECTQHCNFLQDPEKLKEIEDQVASTVTRDAYRFIEKMQDQYGFDCLDLNRYALAKWRAELEDTIDDPRFIKNATIRVKVKVKIQCIGEST